MNETRDKTACFTGHKVFSQKKMERIEKRLNEEIDRLINEGITTFISGGEIGFDHSAASTIITKKDQGVDVKSIFALPCHNQDKYWTEIQKYLYYSLLSEADEVYYVSEEYTPDCMEKRNYYLVDNSSYCICALVKDASGTGQTVRYAQQQGLEVINVAK